MKGAARGVPWAWTKEEPSAEEKDGVRDAAIGENTVGVFLNRTTARGCRRGKRGDGAPGTDID